jgi:hypothetical protein
VAAATAGVTVEPGEAATVVLAEVVDAPFLSAVVEVGAGEVAVEHSVAGESDGAATACASTSSATWFVPAGATTRDASEQLVLFNPFPGDAVVDVTFATPEGLRSPPAFAGLIVPGRGVLGVDVGAVVSRHANVATSVVARTGRLVVDRLQSFDGSAGPEGLDLTAGAPATAEVWHFPSGDIGEGVGEVVTVYNPGDRQAEVDVEVDLDPDTDPAAPVAAEPFQLSIPPQQFAQVVVQDDGRVPVGRGHRLTVRSQNDVGVVAERWVRAASPAPGVGLSAVLGSPVVATRWLAATGATGEDRQWLVLVNPAVDADARVALASPSAPGALADLEEVEVPAAGRVVIDLSDHLGDEALVLVVSSTSPLVVERVELADGTGRRQAMLLPSSAGARVAVADAGGAAS